MKWEYLVEELPAAFDKSTYLNNLGDRDWELVTIEDRMAYLKRPIRESSDCGVCLVILNKKNQLSPKQSEQVQEMIINALDRLGMADI